MNRRTTRLLVLLACLAAAIRAAALWADRNSLLYQSGGLDAPQYIDMARRFADGRWPNNEPFFWAPGYTVFLGLLTLISAKVLWLKAVQVGLGATSCLLVGVVASRLFGNPWVSLLSTGIAALYGPLVYYDLQISPASFDVFLYLLLLVALLDAPGRGRVWFWLLAGIVSAVSAVTRGAVILLLPAVLLWMAHDWPGVGRRRLLVGAVRPLALLAPVALVITLVFSHNQRHDAAHRPLGGSADMDAPGAVPISYNFGINFLLGNVPALYEANRVENRMCFLNYKTITYEPVLYGHWRPSAQSRFLFDKATRWIAEHPVDWLRLMGKKLAELVHGKEISRDTSIYAARIDNPVLAGLIWKRGIAFPSGLLIPLALTGIALAPKKSKEHFLVLAALASQAVFVLAFFVTTRYRLTLLTCAIPYAAYALIATVTALRSGNLSRTLAAVAATGVLLVLSNHALGETPARHLAFEYDHLGHVLDGQGKHEQAASEWQSAVALDPDYASAHFELGKYYSRRGDLLRAESHYTRGLQVAPMTFAARMEYANLLIRIGRLKEATEEIRRAVSQLPSSAVRQSVCVFAALSRLDLRSECER